jgi:spermidine/putrescine transport system permease protein
MPAIGRGLAPYLFLLPGGAWLIVFFVVPMLLMFSVSLQEGSLSAGFALTWNFGIYPSVISEFWPQFTRAGIYAFATTFLTLLLGFPMAYFIAFRGGRWKTALLLIVILPFFVSFIIRTLNWKLLLADNGLIFGTFKDLGLLDPAFHLIATPAGVVSGLTYNFLPFMVLPLYVALEKIDRRLIEAAEDLYASRAQAFWRVTVRLALPGIVAGSLLVFIPAVGDFINAELLGSRDTAMIGNIIQFQYLTLNDYPAASALGFSLVAIVLVLIAIYVRAVGTEQLTG